MEQPPASLGRLAASFRLFTRRLLTIGENRLELLTVEVQEERERLLHALLMALAAGAFGLLSMTALTAAVVISLWTISPVITLLVLAGIYGVAGALLCLRLRSRLRDWQTLSATLEQLKQDRACLEKLME